jgi:hypothetical protein
VANSTGKGAADGNPGPGRGHKETRSDDTTAFSDQPKTLADMGVSKQQSAYWQGLAAIPEDKFEVAFNSSERPTTS